jgi:sulfide dehydrogenase cytochrome subunit
MKKKFLKATSASVLCIVFISLISCKDNLVAPDNQEKTQVSQEMSLKSTNIDLPGRVLASNCFQCHGTNGYAGELKIGEQSASSIISDINEMKTKDPRSNIMNVHAKAYTTEEIKIIADYISQQSKY